MASADDISVTIYNSVGSMDLTEIQSIGKSPVSELSPTGEDIAKAFDDRFAWLQQEIKKGSTPIFGGDESATNGESGAAPGSPRIKYQEVDWAKIKDECIDILQRKSKHLFVSCLLTRSMINLQGASGMTGGLSVTLEMMESFWDNLHPKARNRPATLSLQADDCLNYILGKTNALQLVSADCEQLRNASDITHKIGTFLSEKSPQDSQALGKFRKLKSAIDSKIENLARPAPAPPSAVAQSPPLSVSNVVPRPMPSQAAVSQAPAEKLQSSADLSAFFSGLRKTAPDILNICLKESPADPLIYQWLRTLLWGERKLSPQLETHGLPDSSPPPQAVDTINKLIDEGKWLEALGCSERQFISYWSWLDLQYFTCMALEKLGSEYTPALDVVKTELALFLRRFPFFPKLEFKDKKPVAGPETIDWLETIMVGQVSGSGIAQAAVLVKDSESEVSETLSFEAGASLSNNLSLAQAAINQSDSGKRSFLLRLQLAQWLFKQREFLMATKNLALLDSIIISQRLEEWEPALVAETLILYHASVEKTSTRQKKHVGDTEVLLRDLLTRINALDAVAAHKLLGS